MASKFRFAAGRSRVTKSVNLSERGAIRDLRKTFEVLEGVLQAYVDHLNVNAGEIMIEALRPTFEKSHRYTPVDKGTLKESGFLRADTGARGTTVAMGYGEGGNPFYTAIVHERTDLNHESPTRAKFLQSALEEDFGKIQKRLIKGFSSAADAAR